MFAICRGLGKGDWGVDQASCGAVWAPGNALHRLFPPSSVAFPTFRRPATFTFALAISGFTLCCCKGDVQNGLYVWKSKKKKKKKTKKKRKDEKKGKKRAEEKEKRNQNKKK